MTIENTWFSVEDKIPDEDELVICIDNNGYPKIGNLKIFEYDEKKDIYLQNYCHVCDGTGFERTKILYWCHLPELKDLEK